MQRRQILGVLGAFCLAIGAFAPVVSVAAVREITYFRSGNGVMLAIALVSLAIALRNQCAWLLPAGLTALAMIITTVRTARSLIIAPAPSPDAVGGAPIQLDWGLGVLLLGVVLLIVSAFMKARAVQGAPAAAPLPRLVLITTFVIAAVLMGTVWLWPTGTFILLPQ
jgi:hypothetical protein